MCFTYHQHKAVFLNMLKGQHIKLDIVGVGLYFHSLIFHSLKNGAGPEVVGNPGRSYGASFLRQAKFAGSLYTVVALKVVEQTVNARKLFCLALLCVNVLVLVNNLHCTCVYE